MKNKSKVLIITVLLIVIIIFITIATLSYIEDNKVGEFKLADYEDIIKFCKSDNKIFGEAPDSATAKRLIEQMWREGLGDEVNDYKPFKVSFDKDSKVWLVCRTN